MFLWWQAIDGHNLEGFAVDVQGMGPAAAFVFENPILLGAKLWIGINEVFVEAYFIDHPFFRAFRESPQEGTL